MNNVNIVKVRVGVRGGIVKGSREGSIINTKTSFKKGGAVKGKKSGRLAKRGYGKARK